MNDLPENIELMRKIVMGRIEDSLQNIPNDRLREETYIFWDKVTCSCDYKQLRNLYYNTHKFVNRTSQL